MPASVGPLHRVASFNRVARHVTAATRHSQQARGCEKDGTLVGRSPLRDWLILLFAMSAGSQIAGIGKLEMSCSSCDRVSRQH